MMSATQFLDSAF